MQTKVTHKLTDKQFVALTTASEKLRKSLELYQTDKSYLDSITELVLDMYDIPENAPGLQLNSDSKELIYFVEEDKPEGGEVEVEELSETEYNKELAEKVPATV